MTADKTHLSDFTTTVSNHPLPYQGKMLAFNIAGIFNEYAPQVVPIADGLDDGGLTIEFEVGIRSVLIAIVPSGKRVFSAKTVEGDKEETLTGQVITIGDYINLAKWLDNDSINQESHDVE